MPWPRAPPNTYTSWPIAATAGVERSDGALPVVASRVHVPSRLASSLATAAVSSVPHAARRTETNNATGPRSRPRMRRRYHGRGAAWTRTSGAANRSRRREAPSGAWLWQRRRVDARSDQRAQHELGGPRCVAAADLEPDSLAG